MWRRCWFCGRLIPHPVLTREHLVPKSKGGRDTKRNVVLAHGRCNQAAGAMSLLDKLRLRQLLHGLSSRGRAVSPAIVVDLVHPDMRRRHLPIELDEETQALYDELRRHRDLRPKPMEQKQGLRHRQKHDSPLSASMFEAWPRKDGED